MWNAKKKKLFMAVCLISFIMTQSCISGEKAAETDFEFVKADKHFIPPANETVAILLYLYGGRDCNVCPMDCNSCPLVVLIGDKTEVEKVVGKELEPLKLVKDRDWLEKIMKGYSVALKEAEEKKSEGWSMGDAKIIFVTQNKGYMRNIDLNEDSVSDEYMESELLRDYFKELGLIPTLPQQTKEYFIPPKDETVAILLYRYQSSIGGPYPPIALFGDKKQAEKTLYGDMELMEKMLNLERLMREGEPNEFVPNKSLEPNEVFDGRDWLEKIMDTYETALKEAEEGGKEKREFQPIKADGSVIFVTRDKAYRREIMVDETAIHDADMDSKQLKVYFDQLGLTNELLEGKPPKKFEVVMAGNYFVPPADETIAIVLCRGLRNIAALIGNKKLTEQLVTEELKGKPLEPRRIIEGRDWLVKIMNVYKDAVKDAKEKNYYRSDGGGDGYIWFITPKKGYIRGIGISDSAVHDFYMESSLLKKYFDELGITKELLAGEPNKAP